jgi:hypothetical protein
VPEAEEPEDEEHERASKGRVGGIHGDDAHRSEGVGVEQEAAQGRTHEERLSQVAELGDGSRVGIRSGLELLELARDLGVGLAARGLVHVNEDVVVGVGLGLLTGLHRLAGELGQVGLDERVSDAMCGAYEWLLACRGRSASRLAPGPSCRA